MKTKKVVWHLAKGQSPCGWCCDDQSWNGTPGFFRDIDVDFYPGPGLGVCPGCGGTGIAGINNKQEEDQIIDLRFHRSNMIDRLQCIRSHIQQFEQINFGQININKEEQIIFKRVLDALWKEKKIIEELTKEYTFKEFLLMLIVFNKWTEAGSHPNVYAASVVNQLKEYMSRR
ncbi:MAG: hypothetical protein A3A94_01125 [Candidatus Portnoybacteria bacterium RIFCSPLOWO2_01_FULL_43_11]|uniref:Uncharacterized protein n=3 Tax=Bacteria candidate phyla TaxID=1783234 RepID=A0A1G2FRZ0_9BACT|nr:MAG: hypothetical protein A2713_01740 [candidate division WWE3 bacterium RIFCSPHIGHO2_01_FULL_35_17]OGZ38111.1 MAG: hypothetical protein A3A94_01125 [Candidatus Portnoybacteria bacterium RIFCSPLOWO2_01_FULL_43_11]OGZ40849.1 MAG: hypothetical protein A3I20_02490 [Candidatus Portnoybacteria bacterium RIFCSPLOWO2_02_FULL_40_15]